MLNKTIFNNFNVLHGVQTAAAGVAAFMTFEASQGNSNLFSAATEHTVALVCGGVLYLVGLFSGSANQSAPAAPKV